MCGPMLDPTNVDGAPASVHGQVGNLPQWAPWPWCLVARVPVQAGMGLPTGGLLAHRWSASAPPVRHAPWSLGCFGGHCFQLRWLSRGGWIRRWSLCCSLSLPVCWISQRVTITPSLLRSPCGLAAGSLFADLWSGFGVFADMSGHLTVFAVVGVVCYSPVDSLSLEAGPPWIQNFNLHVLSGPIVLVIGWWMGFID